MGQDRRELQGRWLLATAVDHYAATLLGGFGATETQLDAVPRNPKNFGTARTLAFLRTPGAPLRRNS